MRLKNKSDNTNWDSEQMSILFKGYVFFSSSFRKKEKALGGSNFNNSIFFYKKKKNRQKFDNSTI
jgi:hypothetical protein